MSIVAIAFFIVQVLLAIMLVVGAIYLLITLLMIGLGVLMGILTTVATICQWVGNAFRSIGRLLHLTQ